MRRTLALIVVLVGLYAAHAHAAGKISFTGRPDGTDHIYLMNPDGSDVERLTTASFAEGYASWSADGTKITFEGYYNGVGVYVANADGSNVRRLSPTPGYDVRPSWSPDGTKIIFSRVTNPSDTGVPRSQIMVMNVDGSSPQVVWADHGTFNVEPQWSPDGAKIVFMSGLDHTQQLWLITLATGALTKITSQGSNGDPNWSPDSKRIAFSSNRDAEGGANVFTLLADGKLESDVRRVTWTSLPFEAGDPGWSPDGAQIALEWDYNGNGQSNPDVYAEIWISTVDGSSGVGTRVICSSVGCSPRWQP